MKNPNGMIILFCAIATMCCGCACYRHKGQSTVETNPIVVAPEANQKIDIQSNTSATNSSFNTETYIWESWNLR